MENEREKKNIIKNKQRAKRTYVAEILNLKLFITKPIVASDENKEEQEELKQAASTVASQKSKKKKLLSLSFFLINIIVIAVILVIQLSGNTVAPPGKIDVNGWFLLAAVGCFLCMVVMDAVRDISLVKKVSGKMRPALGYKLSTMGRYYDNITPVSQPFQIYYLNKYGVSGGASITVVMAKYIFSQLTFVVMASIFLFGNAQLSLAGANSAGTAIIYTFAWVGYGITAVLVLVVGLICLNKKIGVGLVVGVLKPFCKLFRLDYKKYLFKILRITATWQKTMREFAKSPMVWILTFLNASAQSVLSWFIPFFVYCAFVGWAPDQIFEIMTLVVMTGAASRSIPLPGGAGMNEISFTVLFASLFAGSGAAFWSLIIWRIILYYAPIAHGFAVMGYDYFIGNKRLSKYKEKWMHQHNFIRRKNAPRDLD